MLKGKKINLRFIEKKDLQSIYDMCSDPLVRNYDGGQGTVPSVKYMMKYFDELFNGDRKGLGIINEKNILIGYITYKESKATMDVYSVGITIGSKFWGKGYGTDSMKTIIRYLFLTNQAHRIELEVVEYNERAIKCYKTCGFIEEGRKRKKYFHDGDYRDTIIMSILDTEYLDHK